MLLWLVFFDVDSSRTLTIVMAVVISFSAGDFLNDTISTAGHGLDVGVIGHSIVLGFSLELSLSIRLLLA